MLGRQGWPASANGGRALALEQLTSERGLIHVY